MYKCQVTLEHILHRTNSSLKYWTVLQQDLGQTTLYSKVFTQQNSRTLLVSDTAQNLRDLDWKINQKSSPRDITSLQVGRRYIVCSCWDTKLPFTSQSGGYGCIEEEKKKTVSLFHRNQRHMNKTQLCRLTPVSQQKQLQGDSRNLSIVGYQPGQLLDHKGSSRPSSISSLPIGPDIAGRMQE